MSNRGRPPFVGAIPVVIACCACGQWLDAGPSIAAGWVPVLVQCQDCGGG